MSVSVDGFVGGPDGEIDWIFKSMDEGATKWTVDAIWQAGVHIMGSRTFHDMASYWPYSTEVFAPPMNTIPKVVFTKKGFVEKTNPALTTTALKDASLINPVDAGAKPQGLDTWANAVVAAGNLADEINRLKQQPGKDILAHGGASFAQSLVESGLIDEYQLLIHPVALGKGLPLFGTAVKPVYLKLISSIKFDAGCVAQIYRPVQAADK